jgi:murein DD-endopeptidase MepM/ murein hydrolase activator NlpD
VKDSAAPQEQIKAGKKFEWLSLLGWVVALLVVCFGGLVALSRYSTAQAAAAENEAQTDQQAAPEASAATAVALPDYEVGVVDAVLRQANLHTNIPERSREVSVDYTVTGGDSVFSIATQFSVKPETILWANYSVLNDNPDQLSIGQTLKIPPTDGVLYTWKKGDTLESIAQTYKAKIDDILAWPQNNLDMDNPVIQPGQVIMIPNGKREFHQWLMPTIPRGAAGVATKIQGTCDTGSGGAIGTGVFQWPSTNHFLSGNDYWSGHLAIDIAAGMGSPVWAADGGVVVFAGFSNEGYGRMVMIDHGDGYQTLYAHLSILSVSCGQSVGKGQNIGLSGSTGNSTGPHLHFEVRYGSGFINPWYVLPR